MGLIEKKLQESNRTFSPPHYETPENGLFSSIAELLVKERITPDREEALVAVVPAFLHNNLKSPEN
jgi:hypothetical protein